MAPVPIPDPIAMIRDYYADLAKARDAGPQTPVGVIRGSSIGSQPRKQLLLRADGNYPPEVKTDRSMRTFEVGDQRHDSLRVALVAKMKKLGVLGKSRIPTSKDQEEEWEIDLGVRCSKTGENWRVVGHPDGVMESIMWKGQRYDRVLLEIKTTSAMGWKDIQAGIVDQAYLDQAQLYMGAADLRHALFVYEKKDTQHLDGVLIDFDRARYDYLLRLAQYVVQQVEAGVDPLHVEPCHGESFGWESTRKKVDNRYVTFDALGWKCSYCDFAKYCFPTHVRMVMGGKPLCVPFEQVPADAVVVAHGVEVTPRSTWKLCIEGEEES